MLSACWMWTPASPSSASTTTTFFHGVRDERDMYCSSLSTTDEASEAVAAGMRPTATRSLSLPRAVPLPSSSMAMKSSVTKP